MALAASRSASAARAVRSAAGRLTVASSPSDATTRPVEVVRADAQDDTAVLVGEVAQPVGDPPTRIGKVGVQLDLDGVRPRGVDDLRLDVGPQVEAVGAGNRGRTTGEHGRDPVDPKESHIVGVVVVAHDVPTPRVGDHSPRVDGALAGAPVPVDVAHAHRGPVADSSPQVQQPHGRDPALGPSLRQGVPEGRAHRGDPVRDVVGQQAHQAVGQRAHVLDVQAGPADGVDAEHDRNGLAVVQHERRQSSRPRQSVSAMPPPDGLDRVVQPPQPFDVAAQRP